MRVDQPSGASESSFSDQAKAAYSRWYFGTPSVTRALVWFALAGAILCMCSVGTYLSNNVYDTIIRYQLWRVVTAGFVGTTVIGSLFAAYCICQCAGRVELSRGSMFVLLSALIMPIIFQACTTLIAALLYLSGVSQVLMIVTGGYWPLCFFFLVLECNDSSQPTRQFFCLPVQVPTVYLPWILGGIFFLLSEFREVDVIVALCVSTLCSKFPQLLISPNVSRYFEEKYFMQRLVQMPFFVAVDGIGYTSSAEWFTNNQSINSSTEGHSPNERNTTSSTIPFSGKGYTLGGRDVNIGRMDSQASGRGPGLMLADRVERQNAAAAAAAANDDDDDDDDARSESLV